MHEDVYIFKPARNKLGAVCWVILTAIPANIYFLQGNWRAAPFMSLVFLVGAFVFLFIPILRNQKLLIAGQDIMIFSFGRSRGVEFTKDLREVVVKGEKIVSYRFEKDGGFYQISPRAYCETSELESIFRDLMNQTKHTISIVEE